MKPVGIFYATRQGHTQRIAERIAMALRGAGVEAELKNLRAGNGVEEIPISQRYGAVILAASVHAGFHEPEMVSFVKRHRAELEALPNAFLSATLSQAGVEDTARPAAARVRFAADVESVLARFRRDTGWTPQFTKPVAGALLYTQYNFFIRFIMKRIARKAGVSTDTSRD